MEVPLLPMTESQWRAQSRLEGLSGKSIHDGDFRDSASNMDIEQFLLLRVLYRSPKTASELEHSLYIPDRSHVEDAEKFLRGYGAFGRYYQCIQSHPMGPEPFPDLGTFTLARSFQLDSQKKSRSKSESMPKLDFTPTLTRARARAQKARAERQSPESPTRALLFDDAQVIPSTPSSQIIPDIATLQISDVVPLSPFSPLNNITGYGMMAIEDEQIVNSALVSFLKSVTIHSVDIKGDWSLLRQAFSVAKSGVPLNEGKIYEARVDGVFRARKDHEVKAIMEVKPYLRRKNDRRFAQIRVQEAGQMAAWICSYPPRDLADMRNTGKLATRLLIAQDRHEIYLTFATFGAEYVDYIQGLSLDVTADGFLQMDEYGPYRTDVVEHMQHLAIIIFAFSLQECR